MSRSNIAAAINAAHERVEAARKAGVEATLEDAAKAGRRSVASYVEKLIVADLEAQGFPAEERRRMRHAG